MAYFHTTVLDEQIKALPTVSTASGSVATFDTDLTENLIEVVCDIQYQQASGTPSPQDEKPILTFDDLTLYHNSINLWNEQLELGGINASGKKVVWNGAIRSKNAIPVIGGQSYYVNFGTTTAIYSCWYNGSAFIQRDVIYQNGIITAPNNATRLMFCTSNNYGTTYNNDISINYPSTDTQYHAFNGAYIPFGQTVAKGTLNVTTGKLEITWIEVDLSSLTWSYDNVNSRFCATISDRKRYNARLTPFLCSCYLPITDGRPIAEVPNLACYFGGLNDFTFYVHDSNYTDPTTFDNSLGDNTICYPLQTPIEIQLDSKTITALLNENNIWCDTNGDTSVKYILSVGKAIS